jgi:hypothetical protein
MLVQVKAWQWCRLTACDWRQGLLQLCFTATDTVILWLQLAELLLLLLLH